MGLIVFFLYSASSYASIHTKEVNKLFPKKIYTSIYGKSIELLPYNRKVLIQGLFMFLILMLTGIFSAICFPLVNTIFGSSYVLLSMMLVFVLFMKNLSKPKTRIDLGKEITATSREKLDTWRTVGLPKSVADVMEMPINQANGFFNENRDVELSLDVFRDIRLMLMKIHRTIFPIKYFL